MHFQDIILCCCAPLTLASTVLLMAEPWWPALSPTDGRYGAIPRAQHYFQYQVLIKPSPDGIDLVS